MDCSGTFPTKGFNKGYQFYHKTRQKIYMYKGGGPASDEDNWEEISNTGAYFKAKEVNSDPDTSSWGSSERGCVWYNQSDQQLKMWDGSAIVLVG